MKKKKNLPPVSAAVAPAPLPLLSARGKKCLLTGVGLAVLGFIVLTLTDPSGQNWASFVSPLLLVSGYTLMGVGLVIKSPK